ncbi:MAG: hypothetical protein QM651_03345 [Rhodoblastus sp.]
MGRSTFVTFDMIATLHAVEIEAGLRGDIDRAGQQFDRAEALTQAAVAQTPTTPAEAVELLRIARWLADFGETPDFGDGLSRALAAIGAEGLSGRALHLVRRAGELSGGDPCAERALASFWRGLRTRRVIAAEAVSEARMRD